MTHEVDFKRTVDRGDYRISVERVNRHVRVTRQLLRNEKPDPAQPMEEFPAGPEALSILPRDLRGDYNQLVKGGLPAVA